MAKAMQQMVIITSKQSLSSYLAAGKTKLTYTIIAKFVYKMLIALKAVR